MRAKGKISVLALAMSVALLLGLIPFFCNLQPALADETATASDTQAANGGDWQRIGYWGYKRSKEVRIDGWNYYYESKQGSAYFVAYRENLETGAVKKLAKAYYQVGGMGKMATNGKQIVYTETPRKGLGDCVYRYDIATGKKTKIANLKKFSARGFHSFVSGWHVQGNYFYFSYSLGDHTTSQKIYRVNIKTGKMSLWKKGYRIGDNAMDVCSGKSMTAESKKGATYLLSIKGKKLRKVSSKSIDSYYWNGGKMYYLTLSKKTAQVHRCNWDGKSNKVLYKFALKRGATADAGSVSLDGSSVVFYGKGNKMVRYTFKTKKWKSAGTFWDYIYPY